MRDHVLRRASLALALVIGFVCLPGRVAAQEAFYTLDQVSQQPRLASPTKTADLLRGASRGVAGTVRVQFIVGADGKVEAGTVRVVHSTNDTLTSAAESVAPKLEFRPGEKDGKPVRTQVTLPLTFQ
jgi:TonB family protein